MPTHFILIWAFLLSISCKSESNEKKLARFKDVYLNESDVLNEIPITLNQKDSAIFADNYIHNWLVNQMIMDKSEEMIPLDVIKVEKKQNGLIKSTKVIQEGWMERRLDSDISMELQAVKHFKIPIEDLDNIIIRKVISIDI